VNRGVKGDKIRMVGRGQIMQGFIIQEFDLYSKEVLIRRHFSTKGHCQPFLKESESTAGKGTDVGKRMLCRPASGTPHTGIP
jgi:hypothetical protein